MDPFSRLFIWMWRLARRPVSRREITIIAVVIVVGLTLATYEHFFGWPEALTVNRTSVRPTLPTP